MVTYFREGWGNNNSMSVEMTNNHDDCDDRDGCMNYKVQAIGLEALDDPEHIRKHQKSLLCGAQNTM